MELNICHLYPDVLNMYGDRGNVLCLQKRLEWRGITCNVEGVSVGEKLDASKYDIFVIGSGQSFEEGSLLEDLAGDKAREIRNAVEEGKVFLAVCGGYQMLGKHYQALDGKQYDLVGALDMYTVEQRDRMTGDYMYECEELPGKAIIGFENHTGATFLGEGVRPVGKVISGSGNNGKDGSEGARYKNVYGTYGHGCLLPKNPEVADMLLSWALENKYPGTKLEPLNDAFENSAHDYMESRLRSMQKK